MYRRVLVMVSVSLLFGFGACIEDPAATDDQFALTQEDAELLGLTFWRQALEAELDLSTGGQGGTAALAPAIQLVPQTYTNVDTTVVACALSGEIGQIMEASITIDPEAGELQIDATLTLTHDACREELEGQTFSFYGAPNIVVTVDNFFASDGSQTISGSINGEVVVITEGAPLLCEASVVVEDGVIEGGTASYRIRGSFCGSSMDQVVTEPANG